MGRRMLCHEDDRPSELAAHRDSLGDSEDDESEGGGGTDLLIRGQDAYQEGGHAHGQHRHHESRLAPRLVAKISEERAAHRTGGEPYGEDAESSQERG